MQNRRRFLSLLGVGAASAPLAAKAVADAEIAKLVGISGQSIASTGLGLAGGGLPTGQGTQSGGLTHQQMLIATADYIKAFGIPEVIEVEIRDQAKRISALDPDIACKRSWSMSVKVLSQRERNYQRIVERMKKTGWQQRKRSAIKAIMGFEWPW